MCSRKQNTATRTHIFIKNSRVIRYPPCITAWWVTDSLLTRTGQHPDMCLFANNLLILSPACNYWSYYRTGHHRAKMSRKIWEILSLWWSKQEQRLTSGDAGLHWIPKARITVIIRTEVYHHFKGSTKPHWKKGCQTHGSWCRGPMPRFAAVLKSWKVCCSNFTLQPANG